MNEKQEAPQIQSPVLRWLDNFWYHYKWHTVFALFLLLVILVTAVQCSHEEESDLTIAYAGNHAFTPDELEALEDLFGIALPQDYDGNGEKQTAFAQFSIFSEEQLTELYTYYDEEAGEYRVDKNGMAMAKPHNADMIKSVSNYLMTGDCAVWLVSPYVYENRFQGINVVETISLKDTGFYQKYAAAHVFPEDTLVVLVKPILGAMSKPEHWQGAEAYVKSLKEFPIS